MSKIWFTSDTHFGSERTLELSKRPFQTVEEMDNYIIEQWNSIVRKEDTVYHLGDFGNYDTVKKLNGSIVLLFGNYERKDEVDIERLIELGFLGVYENKSVMINVPLNERCSERYIMAHEPSNLGVDKTFFCLFGHIHKLQMVRKYGLNVGVDCHNFKPIDIETVRFYKNAIENFYDEEVFNV
ncbi:MAG: metallophosphoesterase family protein [Sarcina sp.]